ncbi:Crp/Fnr family transcriptional regulator [Alginatibacterium sediminis]|uniref:Crp/Fnr family transcriptional regulator n=1 Tax=Alginatibacterium sediminis TaxID=2164068 RepID=A0A420EAT1_9ALTE|nr:Crp/Fnr family transcriptional regulator [Alginatibacterium sediminis]RKF17780.1 Crp/Fnr family transcriptional regulator [Alginatibacterium sediminis]
MIEIFSNEWPCDLSQETKLQLSSIAKLESNLVDIGIGPDSSLLRGAVYIRRGQFSMVLPSGDGRTTTGYLLGAGEWLSGLMVSNDQTSNVGATALSDLELVYFPHSKLFPMFQKNFELYKWLSAIQANLQLKVLQTAVSYLHSLEARVVYFLFDYLRTSATISGALPQLKLNQSQVSEIVGVTRPRVNQVFQVLAKAGEIEIQRGTITFLNIDALGRRLDNVNLEFRDPRTEIAKRYTDL